MGVLDDIRRRASAANTMRRLRQLTAKEKTREKRLRRLLDRLNAGKDVARRDLENALTADEWAEYESFAAQEDAAKENSKRPSAFDRYVAMLKRADFYNNRALVTPTTKRTVRDSRGRTGALRLQQKAESGYEAAIIHLEELLNSVDIEERLELLSWLDREVDFGAGSTIGADAALVPRLKNSKSIQVQSSVVQNNIFIMRRKNKAMIVQQALDSLIYYEAAEASGEQRRDRVKQLLHKIGDDDF